MGESDFNIHKESQKVVLLSQRYATRWIVDPNRFWTIAFFYTFKA